MTTIDTISFSTSLDFLRDIDFKNFKKTKIEKPNGLKIINHSLLDKKIGLDNVSVNETYGTIKVKASSKVLGANYKKGISLNTIEQFTHEINKAGIKLDQDYIYDSSLQRVDIKNDLSLTKDAMAYIEAMNHLTAPNFYKTPYKTGIAFNQNIKNNPVRLIGYDKGVELLTTKNKLFLNQYPTLIKQFQDVLRIESSFSKTGAIKKYFKSNSLIDILNYEGINHTVFKKVVDNQISFKPFYNTSYMTNTEEKNFAQIYYLNVKYNGNFNSILSHIKSKLGEKTKATYQRGLIKKHLAIINNGKNDKTVVDITEILDSLKEY